MSDGAESVNHCDKNPRQVTDIVEGGSTQARYPVTKSIATRNLRPHGTRLDFLLSAKFTPTWLFVK